MAEPISSTATTAALTGVAVLALFPGVDPAVVLGAFAGAAVFVISSSDLGWFKRIGFFVVSFCSGLLGAHLAASLLGRLLPASVGVADGIGALVAAALAIKVLLWLIRLADDPANALRAFKGGR